MTDNSYIIQKKDRHITNPQQSGQSMMELIMYLGVLGIMLIALLQSSMDAYITNSKITRLKMDVQTFQQAAEMYPVRMGQTNYDGLTKDALLNLGLLTDNTYSLQPPFSPNSVTGSYMVTTSENKHQIIVIAVDQRISKTEESRLKNSIKNVEVQKGEGDSSYSDIYITN